MNTLKKSLIGIVATVAISASGSVLALSSGDTLRIIVPYGAGGGYDAQARLAGPYVEDALEEMGISNVSVVIENVTGGGGAIATTQVYRASGDGRTVLLLDPESSLWQQTLRDVAFDISEFRYIGQQSADPLAMTVRADLGIESFEDMKERAQEEPILLGTSGDGNYDHIMPMILERMLADQGIQVPFDYLHFGGTGDILASLRRNEAEGTLEVISTFRRYVEDGNGRFVFTFGEPDILDQGLTVSGRDVLGLADEDYDLIDAAANFRRVYVAPPSTDDDVFETLSEAFHRALSNPDLIEESAEAGRPILFLDAEEIREVIERETELARQYGDYIRERLAD